MRAKLAHAQALEQTYMHIQIQPKTTAYPQTHTQTHTHTRTHANRAL